MRRWVMAALAVLVAAVVPAGAIGNTAIGGTDIALGQIDIVHAEAAGSRSGSADINVFGTLRCEGAGGVILDVQTLQPSTGGTGTGANNGMTCPAAGKTIKWVITAAATLTVIDEKIKVTMTAAGSTIATATELHVLRWGLHVGI